MTLQQAVEKQLSAKKKEKGSEIPPTEMGAWNENPLSLPDEEASKPKTQEQLTDEEKVKVQSVMTDLEQVLKEKDGREELARYIQSDRLQNGQKESFDQNLPGLHYEATDSDSSTARPVVQKIASDHEQLFRLAVFLVRQGVTDVRQIVKETYETAKKRMEEPGFQEEIQNFDKIRLQTVSQMDQQIEKTNQEGPPLSLQDFSKTYWMLMDKQYAATLAVLPIGKRERIHPFIRILFPGSPRDLPAYQQASSQVQGRFQRIKLKQSVNRSTKEEWKTTFNTYQENGEWHEGWQSLLNARRTDELPKPLPQR